MAGGLTKGKSHAKGGIKMKVKSTGQNIEVEGGEGIINKHTMSSKDKHTYEGKEMTACEIASDLNQKTGNGVSFDCDETKNTDMTPTDPSTGFAKGGKPKRKYKKKKMAKSKKKTGAFGKLVSKIMKRDGIPYKQALAKAKDEYVSGATSQKKQPKKSYKGRLDKLKSKSAPKKSYSGRPKKAKGGELMDADTQVDFAKGGNITIKDIEKSWDKIYGEDIKDEYSGVYLKLLNQSELSANRFDKLWYETYGEDLKFEYYPVYEDLGGTYTKAEIKILEDYKEDGFAKGGKTDGLIAYNIPQEYAYALTNADSSGLTDEDEEILNEFVDEVKDSFGNAFFMSGGDESFEPRFEPSNDVTYNQGADVVTLYIQPSKDYAKGGKIREMYVDFYGEEPKKDMSVNEMRIALIEDYESEVGQLEASIDAESDENFRKEYRNEIKEINKIIKKLNSSTYAKGGKVSADDFTPYARVCDVTGEGMNEGYLMGDSYYVKYEKDLIKELRKDFPDQENLSDEELTEQAYEDEYYYYTEWEDPSDVDYVEYKGKLYDKDELEDKIPAKDFEVFMDAYGIIYDEYAKGGDVSGKPVVESLDKIVRHYNGDEFDLDNYPPKYGYDWMSDAMDLSLEDAKQFAKELDFELEYSEDVEDAKTLQDLQYAILEDTQEKAIQDNTFNVSWWGGVVDFFVLERKEDEGYGEALVILRMHRGGDPRGNYGGYEAFKVSSFIEVFPAYYANLIYQIETNQGTITLETEDMEGYSLIVREDETGTFEVDDYVTLDDVEEKLDMNKFNIY